MSFRKECASGDTVSFGMNDKERVLGDAGYFGRIVRTGVQNLPNSDLNIKQLQMLCLVSNKVHT